MARRNNWHLLLRIEDLDTPRVKPGAIDAITDTLAWLGMDWDAPPTATTGPRDNPLIQSTDLAPYSDAMRTLAEKGLAYPCELSRAQIEQAASAPQEGSHEVAFPASLRPEIAGAPMDFDMAQRDATHAAREEGSSANWRFFCPPGAVEFNDRFAGPSAYDPSENVGDFILWTKRNQPSYQLAVVVDDHRQGVDTVIRGDDLRDSAARQLLLYRALGYSDTLKSRGACEPEYWHLPLVIGEDGKRLAKRHGDTRVEMYRQRTVPREAVIGLIAHWSIPGHPRRDTTAAEFSDRFDPATMSRKPIVFTPEDDAWLLSRRVQP
jgi:glutamyl-tRNA synthetase